MKEFFHAWRRKAGVVTLVMALVLTGMWFRSRVSLDLLEINFQGRCHQFESCAGIINYSCDPDLTPGAPTIDWGSGLITQPEGIDWTFSLSDFGYRPYQTTSGIDFDNWYFPYWFLVIPLTLLSAYLILSKPRQRS